MPDPSNTSSNTGMDVIFDGEVFTEPTMEVRASSFGQGSAPADQVQIGAYETVENWDGPIGEVAIYERNLTPAESQRVNSYFSLKWGTTLDNDPASGTTNYDYVDSTGATIWPGTADAAFQPYHNGVAGIGRDDDSDLTQPKSQSVTSGSVVNIDSGGAFAADRSFLVWGHNGSAATYAVSYTPTSFTPAAGYFHMGRVWKVDETGTVGTVTVMNESADHLLVSSDPNFGSGVTEIALSGGSATHDFADGVYFTFGKELTAPGGVANGLEAWYDAAYGVTIASGTNVSGWADKALNGHDTGQADANRQPFFEDATTGINFNPSIHFQPSGTSTQDMLSILEPAAQDNLMFQSTDDGTIVAVGDNSDVASPHSTLIGWGTDANNPQLAVHSSKMQIWNNGSSPVWTGASSNAAAAQDVNENQPYVFGWNWLNAAGGANRGMDTRLNGFGVTYPDMEGANIQDFGGATVNNEMHIGWNDCCSEDWTGRISEIAVYTRKLTGPEQQKVDTYFAIKYGVSLDLTDDDATIEDGDYIDSGDNVIWDNSANTAYHNDVAGIGRDDAADLDQQKTQSVTGKAVTIDSGATLTADNSFLVWGHNGQDASFGVSYSPITFTPPAGYFHMNRVWKVQESGTVGTVTVMNPSAEHLLVDDDGDFTNGGTTEIALSGGSATVDFASGEYFTFGRTQTAPGGVANGLQFWTKANAGTSTTTDGAPVNQWNDQSGNDFDLTTPTTANQEPTYLAGTEATNFNPGLDFNDDFLYNTSRIVETNEGTSMFSVGTTEDFAGLGTILAMGDNYNDPTFDIEATFWSPFCDCSSPSNVDIFNNQIPLDQPFIWSMRAPNSGTSLVDDSARFAFQGEEIASTMEMAGGIDAFYGQNVAVGSDGVNASPGGEDWSGLINEAIIYNRELTIDEWQKVSSYLALKYGITLRTVDNDGTIVEGDYVSTDGTKVWDYTVNSAYHNDVAGIGHDDAEDLTQLKSKSTNSGSVVTIDSGGAFAADKSYLVWGNNAAAATLSANYDGGTNNRLARVWKVQETGTVGNVLVQIPTTTAAGLQSIIIHSSDPAFGTVDRSVALTTNGPNYEATVDFADGEYFTFSTQPAAVPDLVTSIGQPTPQFTEGQASNVPLTVTNNGTGPTTGTTTTSMTLPANTSAPASFSDNGWTCTTSGQIVTCTTPSVIAAGGGSSTVNVPVTPDSGTGGTNLGAFNGTASTPGESNTGNNAATPMTPSSAVQSAVVTLSLKLILQGAYDSTSGTMRDDLRTLGDFPLTSPYGGSETTSAPVLAVSDANNSIVDWVMVELRDSANNLNVVDTIVGLVQRDGDVVALDGTSTLTSTVAAGNYYVAVHHRNHLAAMTNGTVAVSSSTPTTDFTTMTDANSHGTNSQVSLGGGLYALWAGNANGNDSVIRSGPNNDIDDLYTIVLGASGANGNTNYIVSGYNDGDIDMNGQVIAAGPGNDVNRILSNIINHPGNSGGNANHVITEQLP